MINAVLINRIAGHRNISADANGDINEVALPVNTEVDDLGSAVMERDATGDTSMASSIFGATMEVQADDISTLAPVAAYPSLQNTDGGRLSIDDTSDHVINASESTNVTFTVSGLGNGAAGIVTFTDAAHHEVAINVSSNGVYSADWSVLSDGTITSLLSATDPAGQVATAVGNEVSLDTDRDLNPTISVNAANPADVIFNVGGLEGDETGTVTFTDAGNHSVVVNIGSNGNYSANLSSLANGAISYTLSVTDPAGNVTTVDPTVTIGDGSANAPAGAPQDPNLLSGYAALPPWMVAGVNYAVGYSSGTTLADWESLSGPGIVVDVNAHSVFINNTSNVTINDVDFSLHGGAYLYISNSPNATVSNCNFGGINLTSISNAVITANSGSSNLTIENNVIDGGGAGSGSSLVSDSGGGTITLEYNWLKNFPQHVVELVQSAGTNFSLVYKYNLIEQGGQKTGAHLNYLQFSSGNATSVDVEYNTSYQTPQAAGGEGYQFYDNATGGTFNDVTLAHNTIISTGGSSGTASSYLIHGGYSSNTNSSGYDNYFAVPAAWGAFYPGSVDSWSTYSNVDMINGNIISSASNGEYAPATVTRVIASPSSGLELPGNPIILTLAMSEVVTVSGTPTLSLNDGGAATYLAGSGTNALTFTYTVSTSDSTVSALAITQVNEPNGATINDANGNAANLAGALTTFPSLAIDPPSSGPNVSSVVESPSSGDLSAGNTVTLRLNLSNAVTVAGGIPTLTLNDGGTATYTGGSGTSALTFSYTVGAGQNAASLAATAVNLNGATMRDSGGNAANLSLTGLTQTGPQIDTSTPSTPINVIDTAVSSSQINLSWAASTDNVGVAGYEIFRNGVEVGTSATNSYSDTGLAASTNYAYTVAAYDAAGNLSVQSASASAVTQASWSNLSFPTQTGNFTASFDTAPSQSGADIVIGLAPTAAAAYTDLAAVLRFNSSGTIDVRNGSAYGADVAVPYSAGTSYHFRMVVSLATDTYNVYVTPQGGSEIELASNYAFRTEQGTDTSLSDLGELGTPGLAPILNFSILGTSAITSLVVSPSTGDLGPGKTVTLTLNLNEAITVAGGTPTLTLNDGGTATYVSGTGSNALVFSYTVGASDTNVASLAATAINFNGATMQDSGGNAASLSLNGVTQTGPQIDTTAPTVSSLVASGTGITAGAGDLGTGSLVTLTLNLSEVVTVAGGTPTLTLNDGGTATYVSGTGSNALVFSYTVAAGQNIADLAVTAVNLGTATVKDGAGNTANLTGAVTNPAGTLQIDGTAPTVSSLVASGTGITAGAGDLAAGKVVTLTLNLSEAVTVAGGTPTLTLNDGGTASYVSGTGSNALVFSYTVAAGQNTADLAVAAVNLGTATVKDAAGNAANLTGAVTSPAGTLQIDTTAPTVSSLVASGTGITAGAGDLGTGSVVTLTLNLSEVVTVAGGTPTLTLNDGGTATYVSGTGSNALVFSYTVAAGQNTADLAVMAVNLGTATVKDAAGNAANLAGAVTSPAGILQIDTAAPTVSSLVASGTGITAGAGDLAAGKVVTLTLNMSEVVTVAGGTPTLTLNDGGTATYVSGTGSNALVFSYTVAAGQNTADLAVTAVNMGTATVTDGAGNAANLSGAVTNPSGTLQIDTTAPTVSSLVASGTGITAGAGDLGTGSLVTLTLNLSEVVTVAGGTPTLTLNDGGTATYVSGTGSNALVFSYTVAAGQNIADLAVTAVNLGTATVKDGAGNTANLTGAVTNPAGTLQIDGTAPTVSSLVASGTGITAGAGDLAAGKVVTLTLNLSEAVTVAGGTPTLTLNDGGTASYVSGTGSNALVFSYTVAAGQNTADLAVAAVNLGTATVKDAAGNAANLTGAVTSPAGTLQIDTTAPTVSSLVASGTGITAGAGDLGTGSVVTLTLNLSEVVTVAGGTPTLTLNDGGTATYVSGTGSNALVFSYTVAAGQNTADLAVMAVNLGTATVKDAAGNAANLAGAVTSSAGILQIDSTAPTVSSIAESPSSGDLNAGKVVVITLNMSETVTVNTTGGTPTLTLNDGGTATYVSGSGTNMLSFSYTVVAGQNTPDLMETAVNLNGATVQDGAGNGANLSLTGLPQGSPQIDTAAPSVSSLVASGTGITAGAGDLAAGKVVTLTLNMSEVVTVAGGTPTLTLNDGGTATYVSGTGSNALVFSYTVAAGQNTADLAVTAVNMGTATVTDGAGNAANLSGAVTNSAGILQIDTTSPTLISIVESPTNGHLKAGKTVTLTLNLSEAVTVSGGVPTLTLSDGGTATYTGGSGSSALTFSHTVAAGQNAASLTTTAINLNGATVNDLAGNAASLSVSGQAQAGAQIDTTAPAVTQVLALPASGVLVPADTITMTLAFGEVVNVTGTPTLTLNDGGTAVYSSGTSSNTLIFSYTVGLSDSAVSALAITQANLPNGAAITDAAGNAADLSGALTTLANLQIDPPPQATTLISIAESPASGDLNAANTVTLTLNFSGAVTVAGGIPTLTLNDGGAASYTGGSGTNALTFGYTVAVGENTASLAATAVNLNGATIQDSGGNAAGLSPAGLAQSGPQIDTTIPTVSSVVETPPSGNMTVAKTVTMTVNMSEAVMVTGGIPTLTLDDGGIATYAGGSGTNALTFSYAVAAGQVTPNLVVASVNLGSATITDAAGNAANLTGAIPNAVTDYDTANAVPWSSQVAEFDGLGNLASRTINMDNGRVWTNVYDTLGTASWAWFTDDRDAQGNLVLQYGMNDDGSHWMNLYDTANQYGWSSVTITFDANWKQNSLSGTLDDGSVTNAPVGVGAALDVATWFETPYDANWNTGAHYTVPTAGFVELGGGSASANDKVTFVGAGTLKLDQSTSFAGQIAGFTGPDIINLADIGFGSNTTLGFSEASNNLGGTLTVSDGAHTANIALLGNYIASSFVVSSNGAGGSLISQPLQGQQQIVATAHA